MTMNLKKGFVILHTFFLTDEVIDIVWISSLYVISTNYSTKHICSYVSSIQVLMLDTTYDIL